MATTDVDKLAENVSALQKDMAQVGALVDRLDVTIEKLTEVSTTVSQLLAVQGNRLEFQEKVAERLQELVEKRRQEMDASLKDVYARVEKIEADIYKEMEEYNDSVLDEIKSLRADGAQQHKDMNDRIGRFERWMWTCVGGGSILVFLLNATEILKLGN